ncbi:hypothetical protein CEB3_c02930 [Peptococcaceae bacterium CEB3]|nr:hypothetical protein CEB3_c02930 [Peptococcaceae bacterium CEB3]
MPLLRAGFLGVGSHEVTVLGGVLICAANVLKMHDATLKQKAAPSKPVYGKQSQTAWIGWGMIPPAYRDTRASGLALKGCARALWQELKDAS